MKPTNSLKKQRGRGTWMAQLVGWPTSAQVTVLWFVGQITVSGFVLNACSEPGACFRFCVPFLLCPPPLVLYLTLSLKNKYMYNNVFKKELEGNFGFWCASAHRISRQGKRWLRFMKNVLPCDDQIVGKRSRCSIYS